MKYKYQTQETKMRIVLADDDEDDRFLFRKAFDELNLDATLTIYNSGDELLDYLYQTDVTALPHIVFLDLRMICNKYNDCLKDIRLKAQLKDLTIAIYSSSNAEKDIHETFIGGANVYIHKPADFETLKKSLAEVLKINWQYHTSGMSKETFLFSI